MIRRPSSGDCSSGSTQRTPRTQRSQHEKGLPVCPSCPLCCADGGTTLVIVKICGITRHEDAQFAVSCGAMALGFVFWPQSPRAIDRARAREIVRGLPPFVTPVGVFVNQPAIEVNDIATAVGLGVVQLHGDE